MSLGVKVSANGKTAFLAGDINNTLGAENTLAGQLGHVDLLCMGHHGYYGSNTPGYMDALSPDLLILPGTFRRFLLSGQEVLIHFERIKPKWCSDVCDGTL